MTGHKHKTRNHFCHFFIYYFVIFYNFLKRKTDKDLQRSIITLLRAPGPRGGGGRSAEGSDMVLCLGREGETL